jgi:hypothetical protein
MAMPPRQLPPSDDDKAPEYPDIIPNATTRAAMEESNETLPKFISIEALMAWLHADD